jgi:lysophospholipase L1-like esterase
MKTIHVIGDSISIHYGPYLEHYLGPAFSYSRKEGQIGNLDRPEGANGGDSSMVLAYLRECVDAGAHWDILALNCGLHDIKRYAGKRQVPADDYRKNLVQIFVKVIREVADYVIWIRTTPVIDAIHNARMSDFQRFDADVDKYNAIADREAFHAADWTVDLNGFCRTLGGAEIYADHVHFTEPAQQLQGVYLAGCIHGFFSGYEAEEGVQWRSRLFPTV